MSITPDPLQQRLVDEKDELSSRLMRLCDFMCTSIYETLSDDEKERLIRQRDAMNTYLEALVERIHAADFL